MVLVVAGQDSIVSPSAYLISYLAVLTRKNANKAAGGGGPPNSCSPFARPSSRRRTASYTYTDACVAGYGFPSFIPREKLSIASGFLRPTSPTNGGALLLRIELEYNTLPAASSAAADGSSGGDGGGGVYPATVCDGAVSAGSGDIATDLLSLWKRPGPTSDLIIIATAPAGAAAAVAANPTAEVLGTGAGAAATIKPTTATAAADGGGSSCGPSNTGMRRFDVHRAIVAARCPYFATLFDSGMRDSSARELPLPDTDPAALEPLLHFMYGGGLTVTTRQQARSSLELADRLLLPKVAALLRTHLLSTVTVASVVQEVLWAADAAQTELLTGLLDFAAEAEADLPERDLQQLAAQQPALMAQLFTAARRAAKRSCT